MFNLRSQTTLFVIANPMIVPFLTLPLPAVWFDRLTILSSVEGPKEERVGVRGKVNYPCDLSVEAGRQALAKSEAISRPRLLRFGQLPRNDANLGRGFR